VSPGFVETEGFPQRKALSSPLFRRLVIEPEDVARHVVRVLERGPSETYVPAWYRVFPVVQALAPGVVRRLAPKSAYRKRPESN
jgi:short-subunit dehydrogenase